MKGKQISRRDFLKGAAVGAVGIASAGLLGGCASDAASSSAGSNIKWDREVDVLVVGAGATGVSAAYEAAKAGAKTLILEKAGIAGGTTNYSGGVMQAAGTSVQKELTEFKDDTPEKHFQLWLKSGEGYVDEALVKDLAYGAPEHIEWLKSLGMKFVSVYGHCHVPYIDETLYADRIHVYEGGGAGGSGGILVNTILDAAKALGATIEYNTEVTKLITDASGRVIGASYTAGGSAFNIRTKKGVVLAASSIDWNEEMCRDLSPQQYWDITTQTCLCAKTNTGDGIRMGMELGAAIAGFGGTIDFCAKTGAATSNKVPLFPSFLVNKAGQRFVCEDATYAYHYRAIFQQEKQFDAPTYMIFGESSLIEGAPWNKESVAKDVADGVVITANTIEELANKIGVDADGLAATLADWNALAAKGKDVKFGRKTGLAPISGPFYAYRNVSCNLGALGGLKINTDTQVLKPNGEPIPGLYAGGLNAGGWIGPYYPGSGTALIGTVHWGRKAGANVAKL